MTAFYNEIDPYAAQWLRNLITAGHIAHGVVDERSIEDINPDELRQYTQCHFFAGIGIWSYALRLANWPDDRPVWTGSCPCQPFSAAGKGAGFADERHLWPAFHHLISQCRPPVVFGEQVASKDGLEWLDLVQTDLEGSGYASAAADLCAAGVGAPHIRQRLYWGANANDAGLEGRVAVRQRADQCVAGQNGVADGLGDSKSNGPQVRLDLHGQVRRQGLAEGCDVGGLADTLRSRRGEHQRDAGAVAGPRGRDEGQEPQLGRLAQALGNRGDVGGLADSQIGGRREERADPRGLAVGDPAQGFAAGSGTGGSDQRPSPTNGHWRDADWLFCRDGKWRPVEPGTFPLAHGAASRVGRLRAYGNAIVPQVAQTFIESYLSTED